MLRFNLGAAHALFSMLLAVFSLSSLPLQAQPAGIQSSEQGHPTYNFSRVWGYLLKTEEKLLTGKEPLTDLFYFSASIGETGQLGPVPARPKLPGALAKCRVHLVISALHNRALMHWCLGRDQEVRNQLLEQIVAAAHSYDGLQIDFEAILPEDGPAYNQFLRDLKAALGTKPLSVALPARTRCVEDAFNYAQISGICDAVLVMAYDEHWRTGAAGPIASLAWCQKVYHFASQQIPAEKLVMGLPLYGRCWQKQEVASALRYRQTLDLWKLHGSAVKRLADETPYFDFEQTVTAQVYFEDVRSLGRKLDYYQQQGVKGVGFWRVGQGPALLWNQLGQR